MKNKQFGEYISARRKFLRISQRELAEICGISEHALVNLERGYGNPTFRLLEAVAEALGLEISITPKKMELQ